jgi:hypothetical protein
MSRYSTTGTNPENGNIVDIFYGHDEVPGFKPGYFFQVYSREEIAEDLSGEGIIVNEGFLNGISHEKLTALAKHWQCKLKGNIKYYN